MPATAIFLFIIENIHAFTQGTLSARRAKYSLLKFRMRFDVLKSNILFSVQAPSGVWRSCTLV